jgi:hypothetical protein
MARGPRRKAKIVKVDRDLQVANWFYDFLTRHHQEGNAVPNIGWPLADFSRVASS